MSILVDFEIREEVAAKKLIIEPYDPSLVQPNSYDVKTLQSLLLARARRSNHRSV